MKLFKKLMATICTIVLLANSSIPALAAEVGTDHSPGAIATITITDPDTGKVWTWNVPKSDLQVKTTTVIAGDSVSSSALTDAINTVSITVDASAYLAATLGQSKTLTDSITITSGLTFTSRKDGAMAYVALRTINGSITNSGLYYAGNRVAWYRHSGTGAFGIFYPTSNSYSYVTDTAEGNYSQTIPPYSALECDVFVSGIEPMHRTINVTCNLDIDLLG